MTLVSIALPADYPYQGNHPGNPRKGDSLLSKNLWHRIDMCGFVLLLAGTIILICALEEAGVQYRWSSALIITLCVIAGLCWVVFIMWECFVTSDERRQEPVFPSRFLQSRPFIGMLL